MTVPGRDKVRPFLALALIAATGFAVLAGLDRYFRAEAERAAAAELQFALIYTADQIEKNAFNRISAVENLAAFMQITKTPPGLDQFDRFSASLLARHAPIRSLMLVDTDGVIRHAYPMTGNEAVIGLDLKTRPAAPFVERAMREGRTTVNHPTVTVRGYLAVIARTPFYRDGRVAGLVQGVFDISQIISEVASVAGPRIAFELRDATGQRFFGSDSTHAFPLTEIIEIGDNHWELRLGWATAPPGPPTALLLLLWIGGGLLLASVMALVWRGQTREWWLKAAVAERTEELRTSEERYRLVEAAVDDGIWDINLRTNKVYRSPRWKQILGYAGDEIPDKRFTFFRLVHPADRRAVKTAIRRHLAENVRYIAEFRMRHRNGSYRWVLARGDVLRDAAGRPVRMVGSTTDITGRKAAEERLRLALEASGQAMWELDVRDMMVRYSAEHARLLGYAAGELTEEDRTSFENRIHPADRETVWASFEAHASGRTPGCHCEFRLRTKDNRWKWILSTGKIIERGPEGEALRMIGTHTDIDRRKQLVESLRASESVLRYLLANSPIVLYTCVPVKPFGRTYVSPNVEELFGFRSEQLLYDRDFWVSTIHPDDAPAVLAGIAEAIARGTGQIEYRFRGPDGAYIWVRDDMRLIRRADGTPREFIGSWTDITDRRKVEQTLATRTRELSELYASMQIMREDERRNVARELHDELGQSITALRLDISWLETRLASAGAAVVARLTAMSDTVSQTVDSIRRISENLRPAMLDSLGLVATLEHYIEKFSRRTNISCRFTANGIDCRPDHRATIFIFRTIQEALTNVARHAEASHVSVSLLCDDNEVRAIVQDDGRGLAGTRVNESMGLGLIGIRERVAMLNGRFAITSETGQGVRLEISLPVSWRGTRPVKEH